MTADELATAKSSLELWETIDWIALGFVTIGVIGEYIADFTEFSRRWIEKENLGKLSTLILIVGLVVEVIAFGRVNVYSGQIAASLEESAGRAIKAAGDAKERAASLENENLKLRQLIQPRSLTPTQRSDIAKAVGRFSGRTIEVVSGSYDPESYFLSKHIVASFKKAGFVVTDRSGKSLDSTGAGITGLRIVYSESQRDAAEAIRNAFIDHGGLGKKDISTNVTAPIIIGPGNVHSIDQRPYLVVFVMARPLPIFE